MAILSSLAISVSLGLALVAATSPTLTDLYLNREFSFLKVHAAFVDVVFAGFVALTVLCRVEPKWIAKNHSFPYSSQPGWVFHTRGFDFQLLIFEIFHQQWSSRAVHTVNIICEGWFWLVVVGGTFGWTGLGLIVAILAAQAISYRDAVLAILIIGLNLLYSALDFAVVSYYPTNELLILNLAKVGIVWLSVARTVNHAFEPLPPAYHPLVEKFDDGFGVPAYTLCVTNPIKSIGLMGLGLISEVAAGSPGRFLNPILFKLLWRLGYRSSVLFDVQEAKSCAVAVIRGGWQAHKTTAGLYHWATEKALDIRKTLEDAAL